MQAVAAKGMYRKKNIRKIVMKAAPHACEIVRCCQESFKKCDDKKRSEQSWPASVVWLVSADLALASSNSSWPMDLREREGRAAR